CPPPMMIASYIPAMNPSIHRVAIATGGSAVGDAPLPLDKDGARVDGRKAEAAAQSQARGIRLVHLHLDQLEELILQVSQQQRQEETSQPAPAQRLGDEHIEHADGRGIPAGAEAFHLPDTGAGHDLVVALVFEKKLRRLDQAVNALAPPAIARPRR